MRNAVSGHLRVATALLASALLSASALAAAVGPAPPADDATGAAADAPSSERLLIRNARIVDPRSEEVREGAIVVEGDRIDEVLDTAPEDFDGRELDAGGRWVIPGLYDMHVHSSSNKTPGYDGMPPIGSENAARVMLYAGVTGYLDLFGPEDRLFDLRERQRRGEAPGADLHAAGPILTAPGGHGTQFDTETRTVASPAEARETVASLAEREPDVVKLVYHPAMARKHDELESLDRPTMRALVDEARSRGLRTVAHIDTWQGAYATAEAGVSAVTHTPPGPVPDSLVALMKEREVAWIPTLTVRTEMPRLVLEDGALDAPLLRAVTDSALRASYRNYPEERRARLRKAAALEEKLLARTRTLHEAGIPVLAGTDAGNAGAFQGYTLHRELEMYVEAGMSTWEALRSATVRAGRFLGEESGVRPGDRASLVVLDGSPVDDITNTRSIHRVVHDGRVVDRRELLAPTGVSGPDG